MADITAALVSLKVTDWSLSGEPTNETEFKEMFRKITGEDKDGSAILSDKSSDFGVTWSQVSSEQKKLAEVEPMRLLREERNLRLADSDWMAGQDRTMTDEQKKYRQDLRDITKSATSLDDVKWPTKPE